MNVQEDRGDVAVAVLSAGRGSRLGDDAAKPLLDYRGRPLVSWALDAATGAGLDPVVLVTGYKHREVRNVVGERFSGQKAVTVVHNRRWKHGIASSLQAALAFLDPFTRVGAVCVGLADQPDVGAEAYRRLAAAYRDGADFIVATYGGQRANPVLIARSLWADARELTGDVGARALMQHHDVLAVPCDDTGSPADVDTYADLQQLEAHEEKRPE
jgi:molybdenum cofactor cytidylyltransferase/nicotine blue oxidoreductase